MAAAALRVAARRLGGSGALREAAVSRLSPAVEQPGLRRPLPRFAHTEAHHAPPTTTTTTSGAKAKPETDGVLLKRIYETKEELYDLMTEAHKEHGALRDMKLFECLSEHVQPRPSDPTWRSNQTSRWNDDLWKLLGITYTFAACGVMSGVAGFKLASWRHSRSMGRD